MHRICLLAPLAALSLAACGAASNAATNSPGSSTADTHGSPVALARCMRANGVPNFPDPQGGHMSIQASQTAGSGQKLTINGVPIDAPAFRTAMTKCQKYAPHGGPVSAAQLAKIRAGALAMARCMRTHGVPNFPDPDVRTGPGGFGIRMRVGAGPGSGIDPNSPAFQAAQTKCQPLMSQFMPQKTGAGG